MRWEIREQRLPTVLFQRNLLMGVCGLLLIALFLLIVRVSFMNEKIIIIPEGLKQEVSILGNDVSPSFVEEWASYYTFLLLSASPKTFSYQRAQILRCIVPSSFGALSQKLLEQEEQMKRQNLSTVFYPSHFEIQGMTVGITGTLETYVGDKRMDSSQKKYVMKLVLNHGKLFISEFREGGMK